jgi:hypothetical protein
MRKILFTVLTATVLFASCSKDDTVNDGGIVPNGEITTARIMLTQNASNNVNSRATAPAEGDEGAIKSADLYVFNATKVLESIVTMEVTATNAANKVFQLTTGSHYFYAAINVPAGKKPSIAIGEAMDVVIKKIITVAKTDELYPNATGFMMTNVDHPKAETIEKASKTDVESNLKNNVTIKVGRAMMKASLKYDAAAVSQPASGKLSLVTFLLANNPKELHFLPFFNSAGQLESPFFTKATPNSANYFPLLGIDETNLSFVETDGAKADYGMENSNAIPKQGNATFALIRGKFVPTTVFNKNGGSAQLSTSGDFWRIKDDKDNFSTRFYSEDPTKGSDSDAKIYTTAVKYTGGICYYPFYLADNQVTSNIALKYTVPRNSYWKITITSVDGPGANTPEGVVEDPNSPLVEETYVKGIVEVLPWTVYEQNGGI